MGQHVFIKRKGKNKKSVSNLYDQSKIAIQSGLPMFVFPQGTRRMAVRLPFKDGAYRIALENESRIVLLCQFIYPCHVGIAVIHYVYYGEGVLTL